jgi:2-hydroxy-6-oxonona-2,4-dienedioate hydrolase
MSTMFVSDEAKKTIEAAFERFRAKLPPNESRTVPTKFGETHVLVAGPKDAPPLVLLHGALASSAHAMGELGSLLTRYRVYGVDVLGQSVKSADARVGLDGPEYAEWLVEVLDGLSLARPVVYGISWGGFVASKLVEFAPERIDRLILMVPGGFVTGPVWQGFTKLAFPLMMFKLFPSKARFDKLAPWLMTTQDDDWMPYLYEAFSSYKLDIRIPPLAKPERISKFKRPVLVFGAGEDLSFPGEPLLARVKELMPQAETELLEGARHAPATDPATREKLAQRITKFLSAPVVTEAVAAQ